MQRVAPSASVSTVCRMILLQGRGKLRSLSRQMRGVSPGTRVVPALTALDHHPTLLRDLGLDGAEAGDTVLPPIVGPVSGFNAEGRYEVHKDQPMETAYRQQDWSWEEWHGRYTVTQSRTVDIPYQRYPRTFIPPPSVELTLANDARGERVLVTPALPFDSAHEDALLHAINLLRELAGEAAVLTEQLDTFDRVRVRRLNWEVLPPGQTPWPQLRRRLEPVLRDLGERTGPVVERRLALLTETYTPEFAAIGRAGFNGYTVFGYPDKGVYVLESIHYGNATYVFGQDWEQLSQLTKAEILRDDLQQDRIIHREGWEMRIRNLLG